MPGDAECNNAAVCGADIAGLLLRQDHSSQGAQAIQASDAVRDLVALIDNLKRLIDEMARR